MSVLLGELLGVLIAGALGGLVLKLLTRGPYIAVTKRKEPFWHWSWYFWAVSVFMMVAYLSVSRVDRKLEQASPGPTTNEAMVSDSGAANAPRAPKKVDLEHTRGTVSKKGEWTVPEIYMPGIHTAAPVPRLKTKDAGWQVQAVESSKKTEIENTPLVQHSQPRAPVGHQIDIEELFRLLNNQ